MVSSKAWSTSLGDLVASELRQELLLRRQVEVLVVHNLVPYALGVHGEAVSGYPAVIFWEKHAAFELLIRLLRVLLPGPVTRNKSLRQLPNLLEKTIGLENFVRQCSKSKVKVIFYP